ncbi:MAG: PQQ-like beta-propeller repeat protein, partial [Planctomycetales bacterium]|nr:PQQ-like beta-propeller repeat protein [Planctomycetales bacterium]
MTRQLAGNPQLLLHRLDVDPDLVKQSQGFLTEHRKGATFLTEHWTRTELPHANNLVNVVIASKDTKVPRSEILRVLCPGGVAFFANDTGYTRIEKPKPKGLDAWTHQWHGADGGLVTEDTHVGVPQGLQWVTGPLFAMAGRKSSTQSLVSAGGRNFYVTQNVVKNVGRGKMHQFLVARDAFNGLLLWQRQWMGPFVTGNGETNPRLVASGEYVYIVDDGHVLALDAKTGKTRFRWETAENPDKLIHVGHTILVQSPGGITALDDRLAEVKWTFRDKKTHGTASADDQVLCLVSGRSKDGNFKHELVGINLSDGKIAWRVNTQPQTTAKRVRINFARDGFVALQSHGSLHLFSAKSGDHLWTRKTDAKPGKSYVDERFVGHFLRHGLVWMLHQNTGRNLSGQNKWLGLDPLTGEQRRVLQTT